MSDGLNVMDEAARTGFQAALPDLGHFFFIERKETISMRLNIRLHNSGFSFITTKDLWPSRKIRLQVI